jgi:hypothetical protein
MIVEVKAVLVLLPADAERAAPVEPGGNSPTNSCSLISSVSSQTRGSD